MSLPVTLFKGVVALNCIPANPQTLYEAFIDATTAELPFDFGGIAYTDATDPVDLGAPQPSFKGNTIEFDKAYKWFFWWSSNLNKWVPIHDAPIWGITGGTGLAYTLDITAFGFEAIGDLVGRLILVKAHAVNTGAATFKPGSFAAKPIKVSDVGAVIDPVAGQIIVDGVYGLVYDGTNFVLLNPSPTFAPPFTKSFESVGYALPVEPASLVTIPIPVTFGVIPKVLDVRFLCGTAEHGYAAGEQVSVSALSVKFIDDSQLNVSVSCDAANVYVTFPVADDNPKTDYQIIARKSDGAKVLFTRTKWTVKAFGFA